MTRNATHAFIPKYETVSPVNSNFIYRLHARGAQACDIKCNIPKKKRSAGKQQQKMLDIYLNRK